MTTSAPTGIGPAPAAPSGPNFRTEPDGFDVIFLAGMQSPGICEVTCPKKHDLDKKKSRGSKGGTVTSTGDPLVDFSVKFHLWETAHFDAWPGFMVAQRKTLKVPASGGGTPGAAAKANAARTAAEQAGGADPGLNANAISAANAAKAGGSIAKPGSIQPVAMDCYHPDLARINVLRCVLEEEGSPVPDGKGGRYYTNKYTEYNPPTPSGGTISSSVSGTGAGGTGGKAAEQPAQTSADKMLADLLAKAQAL